eukprot:251619-Chlamydomonas_euryale.AAC.3
MPVWSQPVSLHPKRNALFVHAPKAEPARHFLARPAQQSGFTLLHEAAFQGHMECLHKLLKTSGLDIDAGDQVWTASHAAHATNGIRACPTQTLNRGVLGVKRVANQPAPGFPL